MALTTWRRSHSTLRSGGTFVASIEIPAVSAAHRTWSTASPTSARDRERLAPGPLLCFDDAEVEEILDDAGQPLALVHHALGQPGRDLRLAPRADRLREHRERADRRPQLVADVGDEVSAHALDTAGFGDVAHERDRSGGRAFARQREGLQVQRLLRWTEEHELALGGLTGEGLIEKLRDRLRRDGVGMARAGEAIRGRVADEHLAVTTHDHHTVVHDLQRGRESIAVDPQALGVGFELGEHRFERRGRRRNRVVAARRAERRDPTIEAAREHENGNEQYHGADEKRHRQGGHRITAPVIRTSR